jgi:hypothetical protein
MRGASECEYDFFFRMVLYILIDQQIQFIKILCSPAIQTGVEIGKRGKMNMGIPKGGHAAAATQINPLGTGKFIWYGVSGKQNGAVVFDQHMKYPIMIFAGYEFGVVKNFQILSPN